MAQTKKKTRTRRKSLSTVEVWEGLKENADLDTVQDYNVRGSFSENSAIKHPKFGIGIVTESLHSKIEVVFKEGSKSLVQNRD
ncbi:MAG: hypothetical protein KDD58_06885 [Bdellovibrionales bacterium]|nr:hypothetical protein [Bdellovibrionales bacterium]